MSLSRHNSILGIGVDHQSAAMKRYPAANQTKDTSGICVNKIIFKDIQILFFENLSPNKVDLKLPSMNQSVLFYYQFSGKSDVIVSNEKVTFNSNEQSFYLIDKGKTAVKLNTDSKSCIIQVSKDMVSGYFKEMELHLKNGYSDHESPLFPFHKHQLFITPPMRDCIEEMFGSKREGLFLKLHLESLFIRLMLLQFEQMQNHDCDVFCSLKSSEVDMIYKVKKVMVDNLNCWFTISELSAFAGTNECSLKKGFKEVFGSPVFEFIQNYKMQEAHKMLCETEWNVTNISDKLGYKNATHFSAAFKRKFGISPTEIRFKNK